jgi:hypothetical protein
LQHHVWTGPLRLHPLEAASHAATAKTVKYAAIANTHLFLSIIAIETASALCVEAIELIQDIGRRCTEITGDQQETAYLFEQLSVAIQRGNAIAFQETFTSV